MLKGKRNVFLIGPMGAGKTTIGKQLAQLLHLKFIDTDQEIESRTGAPIDWIFDIEGEPGFREREKNVIAELTQMQGIVLATGGGAVCDPENRNYLAGRGIVVYLETSIEQQVERTRRDKRRPLLQGEKDPEAKLQSLQLDRDALYREIADIVVATNENSIKSVANRIIAQITQE